MKRIRYFLFFIFFTINLTLLLNNKIYGSEFDGVNDYADDRIIVSLSNDVSKKLKDYSINDFPELLLEKVTDLTQTSKEILRKRSGNFDVSDGVSINRYNQTLCLFLKYPGFDNVKNAIERLKGRNDIVTISPDYCTELCSVTPDDEYVSRQWAIDNIQLNDAWEITTGSNYVSIGVIDSGIQGNHPDLCQNIDSTKSVDCTVDPIVNVGVSTDSGTHGTHVVGIIGAKGDNTSGIAGVAWNLKIASLKSSNNGAGYTSNYIRSIDYATAKNIYILNCSNGWKPRTNDEVFRIVLSNYPFFH